MKLTYQIRRVASIPIGPIDPKAKAYMGAYMRMLSNAFSIQAVIGCSIEIARDLAREQLSDADRAILAANAEAVEPPALPEPT